MMEGFRFVMERGITTRRIAAYGTTPRLDRLDRVAVEEPLEIRVDGRAVSVTMRTPGDDVALALGFLHGEGLIRAPGDVASATITGRSEGTVEIELASHAKQKLPDLTRHFYTTSSCGVCGKASVDAIRTALGVEIDDRLRVPAETLVDLPRRLREAQGIFEQTGGLHAAALFDATGQLVVLREDVGRHNAVDKVIGTRFEAGALPARETMLLVSGRASFELVQKAAMAQVSMLLAVGAPSSLAVELADEIGMTLVGFLRDGRFNAYACDERILDFEGR
jgi:FdhD protein